MTLLPLHNGIKHQRFGTLFYCLHWSLYKEIKLLGALLFWRQMYVAVTSKNCKTYNDLQDTKYRLLAGEKGVIANFKYNNQHFFLKAYTPLAPLQKNTNKKKHTQKMNNSELVFCITHTWIHLSFLQHFLSFT